MKLAEASQSGRGLRQSVMEGAGQLYRDLFSKPDWVQQLDGSTLRKDLIAGITGATLVLPQGVAFAAIAGLPPEYGFYASIVPTIVAALLGSSWQAVSGATTALSALVFGALAGRYVPLSPEFISAAISMALLVGIFQLIMGVMRLGILVDFVSHSVMTGFIAGAALLIGTSQFSHILGLALPRPEDPVAFLLAITTHVEESNLGTLTVATTAVATAIVARRCVSAWNIDPSGGVIGVQF